MPPTGGDGSHFSAQLTGLKSSDQREVIEEIYQSDEMHYDDDDDLDDEEGEKVEEEECSVSCNCGKTSEHVRPKTYVYSVCENSEHREQKQKTVNQNENKEPLMFHLAEKYSSLHPHFTSPRLRLLIPLSVHPNSDVSVE